MAFRKSSQNHPRTKSARRVHTITVSCKHTRLCDFHLVQPYQCGGTREQVNERESKRARERKQSVTEKVSSTTPAPRDASTPLDLTVAGKISPRNARTIVAVVVVISPTLRPCTASAYARMRVTSTRRVLSAQFSRQTPRAPFPRVSGTTSPTTTTSSTETSSGRAQPSTSCVGIPRARMNVNLEARTTSDRSG